MAFFIHNEQLGERWRQEGDKVEVGFRGSKGDQGWKGTVLLVRTRKGWGVGEEGGAVGLLVKRLSMYNSVSGEGTMEGMV